jgi:hypothetical protein
MEETSSLDVTSYTCFIRTFLRAQSQRILVGKPAFLVQIG